MTPEVFSETEAYRMAQELLAIPNLKVDALRGIASDLVMWCQGFQGYQPWQQAAWLVQHLKNEWDDWHGTKLMREIFERKFTMHPPDPMDKWKKERESSPDSIPMLGPDGRPLSALNQANISAYSRWSAENGRIIEHARQVELERDQRNLGVKRLLRVRDFMDVDFPQRWWAERELGFPLAPSQNDEVNNWLSVTPEPLTVRKPGDRPAPARKAELACAPAIQ